MNFKDYSLLIITLCSVITASGRAEEYNEYTNGSPAIPTSSIGFQLNISNTISSTIAPSTALPGSFLVVDQNLDASNNGTLYINGGEIHMQDSSSTASVLVNNSSSIGSLTYITTGLRYMINLGPVTANSGNLTINASTPGSITLNSGTLRIIGTMLGNDVDGTIDFGADPMEFLLGSLGTNLTGYADGNSAGLDTDTSNHGSNIPGITGTSLVDTDGAELLINLNGPVETRTVVTGALTLPIAFTMTGNVYVSVPEVNSVILIAGVFACFGVFGKLRLTKRSEQVR